MIFWGATGQARVLRELLDPSVELLALFDNSPTATSPFPDVPLLGGRAELEAWRAKTPDLDIACLVAIGGDRGDARVEIQRFLAARGLEPYVAIHRTAFVARNAEIGPGSQILAQAAVCADARLGEACIVNTGASVDHECVLGDGVHVCPGARLAGCIEIADNVMVGTGAVILPRIKIGANAVIGAGAVVRHDVAPGTVVAGNPARVIAQR